MISEIETDREPEDGDMHLGLDYRPNLLSFVSEKLQIIIYSKPRFRESQ